MARSEKQKLKLLYLKQLLEQESDESHPLTTQYIIDRLEALDIKAERKSIYSDIACLQDFGMDIVCLKGAGGGYYLASRPFELPELKLLVDAVQSSRFLSERKSVQLIDKLATLAGRHDASQLQRQVVVSGRIKNMNESIYYNVDAIHAAIAANSRIMFRYFDWTVKAERKYRPGTYEASPYALVWDDEKYYMIAYSEHHGLTNYRVDKMASIHQSGKKRYFDDETRALDVSRYGKNVFGMFSGETKQVKMRFRNSLTGVVIDRFGRDSMLIPDGEDHFLFTAEITVSPMFFGWLAGFGDAAQILWPASVRNEFAELCKLTWKQYE